MKKILVFGAGKSATFLIEYLCAESVENDWSLLVCDVDINLAKSKIGNCANAAAVSINVSDDFKRGELIQQAAIVISMLPPQLHFLVAKDCVTYSKHLLTASYIDENIEQLKNEIDKKELFFLCEMGLDPGIDHMSAMKIIDRLKDEGVKITSFQSHCGGLISPESDDNPWHYKITWNPANIVMAGSAGAAYLINDKNVETPYYDVFKNCKEVTIPGLFPLAWYPNRDSQTYLTNYALESVHTFIRTTLRHPSFCSGWDKIINMRLTDLNDFDQIKNCKTYNEWFTEKSNKNNITFNNKEDEAEFQNQIDFLDLKSDRLIEIDFKNSAGILQNVLEKKLAMQPHDKDMIVMLHEISYELNGESKEIKSCLIVKGEDQKRTAMAKTVGLPLGIAAKLLLQNKIRLKGLHIPVLPEIYKPVLAELEKHDIKFIDVF